jgi:2-oxoglutarate/2-oxoacid ferredoxin oxidoreductase subunit alpha
VELLAAQGLVGDYLRVRGFPFDDAVEKFLEAHPVNFIIEQNRDGQLRTLLVNETGVAKHKLLPLLVYGGFPLSARHVVERVTAALAPVATTQVNGDRPAVTAAVRTAEGGSKPQERAS